MLPAYCNLNLPDLPEHITDLVSSLSNDYMVSNADPSFKRHGYGRNLDCYRVNPEIEKWIKNNITVGYNAFYFAGIQIVKNEKLIPHVDPGIDFPTTQLRRHYTLLYLIDTGNSITAPVTNFYELIDTNSSTELNVYNEADLRKIQSVQLTKNSWNLLSNQVIHSVTGISTPRIGLAICFFDKELPKFLSVKLNE
jgi:hypothetical protein